MTLMNKKIALILYVLLLNLISHAQSQILDFGKYDQEYFENDNNIIDNYISSIDSTLFLDHIDESRKKLDTLNVIKPVNNTLKLETEKEIIEYNIKPFSDYRYEFEEYINTGFFKDINSYLVFISRAEAFGYEIISKETSERVFFRELPFLSPENNLAVTCRFDAENIDFGELEISGIFNKQNLFVGLWSENIFPIEACWENNHTVLIRCLISEDNKSLYHYYKLDIAEY